MLSNEQIDWLNEIIEDNPGVVVTVSFETRDGITEMRIPCDMGEMRMGPDSCTREFIGDGVLEELARMLPISR